MYSLFSFQLLHFHIKSISDETELSGCIYISFGSHHNLSLNIHLGTKVYSGLMLILYLKKFSGSYFLFTSRSLAIAFSSTSASTFILKEDKLLMVSSSHATASL